MTCDQNIKKITELEKMGVKVFVLKKNDKGHVDLNKVMALLADKGITSILSEGGAQLNASLFRASLVDRLIWFKSPDIIGDEGVDALYKMSINDLEHNLNLSLVMSGTAGPDSWQEFQIIN